MINHPRVADAAFGVSVGGTVYAHWFTVANDVANFGAHVVSIVTGIGALLYYGPIAYSRAKMKIAQWRLRL